jgi:hypothetical protein
MRVAPQVTGHSYVVYGPLINCATVVIFEGVPNYPGDPPPPGLRTTTPGPRQPNGRAWADMDRFWDVCEKFGVTSFYTAPTAIRSLMKATCTAPTRVMPSSVAPLRRRFRFFFLQSRDVSARTRRTSYPCQCPANGYAVQAGEAPVRKHDLSKLRILGTVGEPINPEAPAPNARPSVGLVRPVRSHRTPTSSRMHRGCSAPRSVRGAPIHAEALASWHTARCMLSCVL